MMWHIYDDTVDKYVKQLREGGTTMKFIPKVGETCICTGLSGEPRIRPKYVGSYHVLFDYGSDEFSMPYGIFKPIKTPAEIEREDAIQALVEFLMGYYGNPKGGEHYLPLAESLVKRGYSIKQQVKPLSYQTLKNMCSDHAPLNMIYKLLEPYTIQGGDK